MCNDPAGVARPRAGWPARAIRVIKTMAQSHIIAINFDRNKLRSKPWLNLISSQYTAIRLHVTL